MSIRTKTHRKTIDQRDLVLPPTWCPRLIVTAEPPTRVHGIRRSDASRQTASEIVRALDGAREMIVVMSFLLADAPIEEALLRAAKRGVRVYLMVATEARLDREPKEDSAFEQTALAEHNAMLRKLAGWVLVRSAAGFHAKVVIVDPSAGGPGFLLTSNLTHGALTGNEELGVELNGSECAAVFRHLAWAMWEGAERESLEPGQLLPLGGPLGRFSRPQATHPVVSTLGIPGSLRESVLGLIASAKTSIVVSSFGWDLEHDAVSSLCARARDGVKVTVLARIRPAAMPALLALASSGATVLGYPLLHAKALLVDGTEGLVMTANLEKHGLDDSVELGLHLDPVRTAGLAIILTAWAARAPFELRAAPRLGEILGAARVYSERRLHELPIAAFGERKLPPGVAASAGNLEAVPAVPRDKLGLPWPFHVLEVTWDVAAPRLAPDAK